MKLAKQERSTVNNPLVNWIFDDMFLKDTNRETQKKWNRDKQPKTNILENKNEFIIDLSTPGFSKESFNLDISDRMLKISGNKKPTDEKGNYRMKEFGSDKFQRSFKLSENTDIESIFAEYTNGILRITLPKKEIKKKSLEIKVK